MKRDTVRAARVRLARHSASQVRTWECPSGTAHVLIQGGPNYGYKTRSVRLFSSEPTVRAAVRKVG